MGALDNLPELPVDHGHRIVLGIDPGTQRMGYGAIVVRRSGPRMLAAGTLTASRSLDAPARLGVLLRELQDLMRKLRPTEVVVERAFVARNVSSALRIGEGRGVALATSAAAGADVHELTPAEVKKVLVGNGGASKHQVRRMVVDTLGLDESMASLDTSDALALAVAHVHRSRVALSDRPRR